MVIEEFYTIKNHRIEVARFKPMQSPPDPSLPILLLHEGLGSVSMWKSFPEKLSNSTCCEVIAYSRPGYGKSTTVELPRDTQYMHIEGLEILPEMIQLLCIEKPVLLGHSDGASISIICAGGADIEISGLVLMAPHLFVEKIAINAIQSARDIWIADSTNLRKKLSRYHNDVDTAFLGWNDIWLHKDFRQWNIEEYLSGIKVPVLAIQGYNDEYGTMKQIEVVKQAIPKTELLKLTNCRHSPHLDRPEDVIDATCGFIKRLRHFG